MARTVFVFGAGASAHIGAPLMKQFIDTADDLRQDGNVSQEAFDLVFTLIQDRLPALHAKSVVDLTNIESVFSLVEMGRLVGRLPGTEPADIELSARSMRRVLAETVEESSLFDVEGGEWRPSSPYLSVAGFIERERQQGRDASVALITFNYDI